MIKEYEKMEGRLMLGKNEKYVPEPSVLSLAVYDLREGEKVDSFFLYATDYVTFSEPFARLMVPCDGDDVVAYERVEEHPFREKCEILGWSVPDRIYEKYAEAYMEGYMAIREFVFQENLEDSEKGKLKEYIEAFHNFTDNNFAACYRELAENFLGWAESQLK